MWAHMLLVSSILISKRFYVHSYKIIKRLHFEGGNPLLVSLVAIVIFVVFIACSTWYEKITRNFKQFQVIRAHARNMGHDDTKLWFTQAFTGFAMFFLGSVHLYVI